MIQQRSTNIFRVVASFLFAMILALSLIPTHAIANDSLQTQAASDGGTIGECTWDYNGDTGVLSIRANDPQFGSILGPNGSSDPWPWTDYDHPVLAAHVTSAVVGSGVKASGSLHDLLKNCENMTSANLSQMDTSNATDMVCMFVGCSSLTTLDLSHFNTGKVKNMYGMFSECKSLKNIDMSNFDTSIVEDMSYMFSNCSSLTKLDLSKFNTGNVSNMENMFGGCDSLREVKIGKDFTFQPSSGKGCLLPEGEWRSTDGQIYTAAQVASRSGIADTYVKVVPGDEEENPNTGDKPNSGNGSNQGGNSNQGNNSNSGNANNPGTPSGGDSSTNGTVESTVMYRLYNPYSGEHLFTKDINEYNYLGTIGWIQEGEAWHSPTSGTPVYRLYNPYSGDHHYTTDKGEYDTLGNIGWIQENIGWYSGGNRAVYRLFNPYETVGTHHYTKDKNEYETLGTIGWKQEDVGWYALSI